MPIFAVTSARIRASRLGTSPGSAGWKKIASRSVSAPSGRTGHAAVRGLDAVDRFDRRFDLVAVVVDAIDDDDVFFAAGDREPLVLNRREVAGLEPSIRRERLSRQLGIPKVAGRDDRPLHLQPADNAFADETIVTV